MVFSSRSGVVQELNNQRVFGYRQRDVPLGISRIHVGTMKEKDSHGLRISALCRKEEGGSASIGAGVYGGSTFHEHLDYRRRLSVRGIH